MLRKILLCLMLLAFSLTVISNDKTNEPFEPQAKNDSNLMLVPPHNPSEFEFTLKSGTEVIEQAQACFLRPSCVGCSNFACYALCTSYGLNNGFSSGTNRCCCTF